MSVENKKKFSSKQIGLIDSRKTFRTIDLPFFREGTEKGQEQAGGLPTSGTTRIGTISHTQKYILQADGANLDVS